YQIPEGKIEVVYQSCNPIFSTLHTLEEKQCILEKYHLPQQFFLYVGSVIERKNLLTLCKAVKNFPAKSQVPLVIIGEGKEYKRKVKEYIRENNLDSRFIWLSEVSDINFLDFPAIYQSATALVYPSLFEGFGIPILEALSSGCPVITSLGSCFEETAGDGAMYVQPNDDLEMSRVMWRVFSDPELREDLKKRGFIHSQKYSAESCAKHLMKVYWDMGLNPGKLDL
ncbi:MAG: glycosyltransferase family 4 protein, partial [Chitinophagaceae bacterium]